MEIPDTFWDGQTMDRLMDKDSFHAWEAEDGKDGRGSNHEQTTFSPVGTQYENHLLSRQRHLLW